MIFSICNPLRIEKEVPSFAGTAVVLSDHKRPLALGVYGVFDPDRQTAEYTSVMQTVPGTTDPIACWIHKKVKDDGAGAAPFFFRMPTQPGGNPGAVPPCRQ